MFKYLIIVALCASVSLGHPVEIVEDENNQGYYLVPIQHIRQKRCCNSKAKACTRHTDASAGPDGVSVSHKQTVFNNREHRVDATVSAQRNYHPKGPLTTGQQVDYRYKPSDSELSVRTQNTRGQGTDVSAKGTYNIYRTPDKQSTVGISGTYDQHFGGQIGNKQADYGVQVQGQYDFK